QSPIRMIDVEGNTGITVRYRTNARDRANRGPQIGYWVTGSEAVGATQLGVEAHWRARAEPHSDHHRQSTWICEAFHPRYQTKKGLGECGHHLAREPIDALTRIHVAKNDRKKSNSPAHALAQKLDDLRRGAFDPGAPERQALRNLPFFFNFGVIGADTDQELLRDIN